MTIKSMGTSGQHKGDMAEKRTRSKLSSKMSSSGSGMKMGCSAYVSQAPKIIQKKIKLGFGARKSETSQESMKQ